MAKLKFNRTNLMWIIGILFIMSVFPGEGTKAADQQAIVQTEYTCNSADECPVCVGAGIEDFDAGNTTFLGELSFSACVDNKCELSDSCLVWDCGQAGNCQSIKQTLLDNTLGRINENPVIGFVMLGLIVLFVMAG